MSEAGVVVGLMPSFWNLCNPQLLLQAEHLHPEGIILQIDSINV